MIKSSVFAILISIFSMGTTRAEGGLKIAGPHLDTEYQWFMNPDSGEVVCKKIDKYLFRTGKKTIDKNFCVTRLGVTYKRTADDKCGMYTPSQDELFIGFSDSKYKCSFTPTRMDFGPKVNLYSSMTNKVKSTCSELGDCLSILSSQNKKLVDGTLKALQKISINEKIILFKDKFKDESKEQEFFSEYKKLVKEIERLDELFLTCTENTLYSKTAEKLAKEALSKDLEKMSLTLNRDIYVFHWFTRTEALIFFRNQPRHSTRGELYAASLQDNYFSWDFDSGTGMQGRGLYAAQNPFQTENYGDTLLKIKLPKGSKYLNVAHGNGAYDTINVSEETLTALNRAGCHPPTQRFSRDDKEIIGIKKFSFSADSVCRKYFNESIKKGGYVFQSYSYGGTTDNICDKGAKGTAFVLIDAKFNKDTTELYVDPFGKDGRPSAELKELKKASSFNHWEWAGKLTETEREKIRKEWRSKLYNCDKKLAPEEFR